MLGVVAAGFAVTFFFRAVPFLLFIGRDGALPAWVTKFGGIVSPLCIAALVVYSYSTLEWRTCWPYLAGLLTIALHLLLRNSLVSIIAGTAVYMCLLTCGCVTDRTVSLDPSQPSIEVRVSGVFFDGRPVPTQDVPEILHEAGVLHERTIPILLASDVRDLSEARTLMYRLAKAGYRRPVLVTKRHAEAEKVDPARRTNAAKRLQIQQSTARPPIRYKRATEE
jgi:branched-subunit amino acid transport protein AzlD